MADPFDITRALSSFASGESPFSADQAKSRLLWFTGCFARAIERSEKLLRVTLAKAGFWQRHSETLLSPRQRKVINRLLDAGPGGFEGDLTTRKYVSLTSVSRATAFREIADLVSKKILLLEDKGGRNTRYTLAWKGS